MTRNKKLVRLMAATVAATTVATSVPAFAAFDANYYAKQNPDVVAVVGTTPKALESHYNTFGKKEGRAASAEDAVNSPLRQIFDAKLYAQLYPDVVAVFGTDADALFQHFMKFGINEGRKINTYFDVNAYKAAYPDLSKAFGDNTASYYLHFVQFGIKEHRTLGGFPAEQILPGGVKKAAAVGSSGGSSGGSAGGSSSSGGSAVVPGATAAEQAYNTAAAAAESAADALATAAAANTTAKTALSAANVGNLATDNASVKSEVDALNGTTVTKAVSDANDAITAANTKIATAKETPTSANKTAAATAASDAVDKAKAALSAAQANQTAAQTAVKNADDALKAAKTAKEAAVNAKATAEKEKASAEAYVAKLDDLIAVSDKNIADAEALVEEADQNITKAQNNKATAMATANAAVNAAEQVFAYQKDTDGSIKLDGDKKPLVDDTVGVAKELKDETATLTSMIAEVKYQDLLDAELISAVPTGKNASDVYVAANSTDKDAQALYQKYLDDLAAKDVKALGDAETELNKAVSGAVSNGTVNTKTVERAKKTASETAETTAAAAIAAYTEAVTAYNDAVTPASGSDPAVAPTDTSLKTAVENAITGLKNANLLKGNKTVADLAADTTYKTYPVIGAATKDILYTAAEAGTNASGAIDSLVVAYDNAYKAAYNTDTTGSDPLGSSVNADNLRTQSGVVKTKTEDYATAKKTTDDALSNATKVETEETAKVTEATKAKEDAQFERDLLLDERYGGHTTTDVTTANDKLQIEKAGAELAVTNADKDITDAEDAAKTADTAISEATTNKADADAALATANQTVKTAEEQQATANAQVREVNNIRVTEP